MNNNNKVLCILTFYFILSCNPIPKNKNAQIHFQKTEYIFKKIKLNAAAQATFTFTNSGQTPLLILEVKTTCGCTIPKWPKKPVKPGKKGKIIVTYDTSHPGVFSKTIFVSFNGKDSPAKLTIRGEVK